MHDQARGERDRAPVREHAAALHGGHEQTRAFYERRRFAQLWEPHGWWDETNQCLLMPRDLAQAPEA